MDGSTTGTPNRVTLVLGPSGAGKRTILGLLEDVFGYVSVTKVSPREIIPSLEKAFEAQATTRRRKLALSIEVPLDPADARQFAPYSRRVISESLAALDEVRRRAPSFNVIFLYCSQAELSKRQTFGFHPFKSACGSMAAAIFRECELLVGLFWELAESFADRLAFIDTSNTRLQDLQKEIERTLRPPAPEAESSIMPETEASITDKLVSRGWNKMRATLSEAIRIKEDFAGDKKLELNCLILGETGTGKEKFAQLIHSGPSDKFSIIDCASIPTHLLESELFGHAKGAFTDAAKDREGRVSLAEGGTLFLDEIGLVDRATQGKLLRLVETKGYSRLGENTTRYLQNCRVIGATSRDLEDEVKRGNFLLDLYYRLAGDKLTIPPLRERREDIPLLLDRFLQRDNRLSAAARAILFDYGWPANVRQLKHVATRCRRVKDREIQPADLDLEITSQYPGLTEHEEYIAEAKNQKLGLTDAEEQEIYKRVLRIRDPIERQKDFDEAEDNQWREEWDRCRDVNEMARRFKRDRVNVVRRLDKLGIQRGNSDAAKA